MIDLTSPTPGHLRAHRALSNPATKNLMWDGAVRSGKSAGAAFEFVNLVRQQQDRDHIVACTTLAAIKRNIEPYIAEVCYQAGMPFRAVGGHAPHYVIGDAKCWHFGHESVVNSQRVRGITAGVIWADEASLSHEDFLAIVSTRKTFADSVFIATTNADSPYKSLYERYYEEPPPGTEFVHSTFWENQHVPDEVKQQIYAEALALGEGSFHFKRLIGNEWVPAEGLVYALTEEMFVDDCEWGPGYVGHDPGISGTTGQVYIVPQSDGTYVIADEYSASRETAGTRTDATDSHNVRVGSGTASGKPWSPIVTYLDPITGYNARNELNNVGYAAQVADPTIKVETGVRTVQQALGSGKLKIHRRCRQLRKTSATYQYDPNTEKPKKNGSEHWWDATRFVCTNIFPLATIHIG